ncbi:MAG TPA: sulfite exporter TauE/SafE family protein [Candidatus Limnocylindria bacterium]|nr:sulfite exporter TauE/SafE family protein [Candidatus Limnocylindria bacterium]
MPQDCRTKPTRRIKRMPAALMALIGLAAGVLSGLFGIGGGVIIVPLLMLVLGFTAQQAAGTSLAALLLPVGLFGAIQYWQAGQVNVLNAAMLALGLLIGAFLGARLGLALPSEVVQRAFGVLLVIVGLRMALFA